MAPDSTPVHIRKRQYQPSITSYLSRCDSAHERTRSTLSPSLPTEMQSQLLSVGMRVRKAVPEGYKTHKTLGSDDFTFPNTAPPISSASTRQTHTNTNTRELMPFCGLHKIGSWAQQQNVPPSSAPATMQTDNNDCDEMVTALSMSQPTVSSSQESLSSSSLSAGICSKKRTFEEEIEEDMDICFEDIDALNQAMAHRRMARPKASLRKPSADGYLVAGSSTGDFEDADAAFLAPIDVEGV
ncbi:MAG: hypothetical protein FE78DRAFT_103185 [Acidomyces sp. 'richmondensis']|nr:MAG: hypothetical protein FE78DRAFT_103185 [Acidomyces sp. 'richmondensis']